MKLALSWQNWTWKQLALMPHTLIFQAIEFLLPKREVSAFMFGNVLMYFSVYINSYLAMSVLLNAFH